jgi:calcineurin-like phosphoesterase family protein
MYFFTADEHYGHKNIIQYCNRPFESVKEMDEVLIANHNSIVNSGDVVVHAGDFTLKNKEGASEYIRQLNGSHIFLKGSHDRWESNLRDIWEKTIEGHHIVICHYAMRVWARSHYGSWHLYGHSHGKLAPIGKQWDIGVDNNDYYPVSMEKLKEIMQERPDNPNLIKKKATHEDRAS